MRRYTVVVHPAEEGGYWVDVPALPGCYSQGETVKDAVKSIREAIEAHLEVIREDGQPIPEEHGLVVQQVEVAVA
ncbi:MAG: type II toxin-antitoxin system HicB family antitoxin [candidate division NC10 bacterium]